MELGKVYYAGVRSYIVKNGQKEYSIWSGTKSLKLERWLPTPTLNSITGSGSSISSKWQPVIGVEGYQLRFSTDPNFKGIKTASTKGQDKKSFKRGGLEKGKTWYVSVRAYATAPDGTRYYSAWSNAKSVKL